MNHENEEEVKMKIKLEKSNVEDIIPLTPMQEGMLFHYIMEPNSQEYHEQITIGFVGDIDPDLLQKAWDFVIRSNEMLRTVYRWKNIDYPVQVILKNNPVKVLYHNMAEEPPSVKEKKLSEIQQADLQNQIDIENETLRINLCKYAERNYTMIISNHHILYDGWSSGIMIKELISAYHALSKGLKPRVASKNKFSEYVKWIGSQDKEVQKNYWENYLSGAEQSDSLFNRRYLSEMKSYQRVLEKDVSDQMKEFAKENGLTMASLLYAAWGIVLQKLNHVDDTIFGITTSGRDHSLKGIENMIGLFINTIPLRIRTEEEETMIQLLKKVNQIMTEAREFENTPLVDINAYAGISHHSQLFNSLVVIENYPLKMNDYRDGVLAINNYSAIERTNYNLTLGVTIQETLTLNFKYNCFTDDQMMIRISQYFERVISAMLFDKNSSIVDCDLLSEAERNQILYQFNDTDVEYPAKKTIHQLFEEQVQNSPECVALVSHEQEVTYQELNEKANGLAYELRKLGVGPDVIVGVMIENSIEMIVGVLGILKAGGAYLPIDPEYPTQRIRYVLKDCRVKIVLSKRAVIEHLKFTHYFNDIKVIDLSDGKIENREANLAPLAKPSDLAYVVYTSGSTGASKGVMTEHESVVNYIYAYVETVNLTSQDGYLQHATFTFDTLAQEVHPILSIGGRVVIATKEQMLDMPKLRDIVTKHNVTVLSATPQELSLLNSYDEIFPIRLYTCGGDVLRSANINKLALNSLIYNAYGPTECTVYTSFYKYEVKDEQSNIPIGKPIGNIKIYILDQQNRLTPIGVVGQLCIAGAGVTRGYLNQPQLTAEKFVDHPFGSGRLYRTGDLARWLPDGNIEFLGRMDHQVKIHGIRIELEEIENQILKLEVVKEVTVIAKEDAVGDKYLCAYLTRSENAGDEEDILVSELRQQLSEMLPSYMIPSRFMFLEKMPLAASGKVDKRALPKPEVKRFVDYVAPRSTIEKMLVAIWSEVLGKEKVGVFDNFFELGGHSLKATIVMSRIHKELNLELPLKQLFRTPTISEISNYLEGSKASEYASIKPVASKAYYSASSAQTRMWVLQQFDQKSTGYNVPSIFIVEGKVDQLRLEDAFAKLIERHESLRTTFDIMNDVIIQKISDSVNFEVEYAKKTETEIEAAIKAFIRPFNLSKGPLLRVGLTTVNAERHYLMFDVHHIISDGVSGTILVREFMKLYDGEALEEQKIQYKDFSQWQNEYLKSEKMREQEQYWLEQFSDELPILDLPLDYRRPLVQSFEGASLEFKIDRMLSEKLNNLARVTGTTLFMVLLSAVKILLSKYTRQDDIIVGTEIAGRPHADLENIIGMFVNTLVMRAYPENQKTYVEFLDEVKEIALKAYENQDYQFEELVDKLNLHRDISRNPLFDVMFALQNVGESQLEMEGIKFTEYISYEKSSKFDLTFIAVEQGEEIGFSIEYGVNLFKRETVKRMINHFYRLLEIIAENKNIPLGEIDMFSSEERKRLLYEFNDTYVAYPNERSIHQLFEEQAEKAPNQTAIVYEDIRMTYAELNEQANQIGSFLIQNGVQEETMIGIMLDRRPLMVAVILGIWKARGAYLPIDRSYPEQRIAELLNDSEAKLLISCSEYISPQLTNAFNGKIINLDQEEWKKADASNLKLQLDMTSLAYVIYTSGSTGRPKGVMVEHQGMVNHLYAKINELGMTESSIVAQNASHCFDISVWQFFASLVCGGIVAIYANDLTTDVGRFISQIIKDRVNILQVVPSFLEVLIDKLEITGERMTELSYLLVTGEELKSRLVKRWFERFPEIKMINAYGPTEASDDITHHVLDQLPNTNRIPIGKPIQNMKIYIVDEGMNLCPIGVKGEIVVSGVGVGRGYLNNQEKTNEVFMKDPFQSDEENRLYKTGDLGRWLADGSIEFLGRIDHQVKIRGFRIELGEIENQLLKLDGLKEAVVLARVDTTEDKYLCAYLIAEKEFSTNEIRQHLSVNLPEYMIPSYFIQLEKLPLTANGKLDLKALPEPEGRVETDYVAPQNELEEILAGIWGEVLGKERIGIDDNFFELGGHSLKATGIVLRIHKVLNVALSLNELFRAPTISELAEYIKNASGSVYAAIEPAVEKMYYEASAAGKRIWILQQLEGESTGYNMPSIFIIDGELDKLRLENAARELIKRHESLRTSFDMIDDVIMQKVNQSVEFAIEYAESTEADIEEVIEGFIRPFDLRHAPILRVGLIRIDDERHYLLFDMHHIISDGVSMVILTKEFMALYAGHKLEELRIGYKDFSQWQNEYLKSERMREQEQYWLEQFSGELPILDLPLDYRRPTVQSFEGDSLEFSINRQLSEKLNILAQATGATLYMVLLSAVKILLSKYSGAEDIIIGSLIAGRPHPDLEGIIGMFVNTLAIRSYPERRKTYVEFLDEIKEIALKSYENQDYQFEELLEKLNLKRDVSRNPLFDVMFVLQNIGERNLTIEGLRFTEYVSDQKSSKFDLTLTATELGDEIEFSIEYSVNLFKRETIKRLANHLCKLLEVITSNIDISLGEIKILSSEEKKQLLYEFNDTYVAYPNETTIHQLFEEQVEKAPNQTAIVYEDIHMTYAELNAQANQIGSFLIQNGVQEETLVGIMLDRSPLMIAAILGIWKARGAYLPIDRSYPEQRIVELLNDSEAKLLISCSEYIGPLLANEFNGKMIKLDHEEWKKADVSNLKLQLDMTSLAYVIYTSGSTGKPKGAMVEHQGMVNHLYAKINELAMTKSSIVAQNASHCFDISVWQFFASLVCGGIVAIYTNDLITDVDRFISQIIKDRVNILQVVPSFLDVLIDKLDRTQQRLTNLNYLLVTGEELKPRLVKRWFESFPEIKMVNAYGPTEASDDITHHVLDQLPNTNRIPIGKPIQNMKIYIVDEGMNLCPIGVKGEIVVSGVGVGRGYLNNQEKTNEVFMKDPFQPDGANRLYKTGDLGRWLADGSIEFLGRIDHQVKIRGFRIELGEIEHQLLKFAGMKEAVVLARDNASEEKYLCAYLISEQELSMNEIRQHLAKSLPEYMIPSYFVQLEKLPLTANGKIDLQALPEPEGRVETDYVAPQNELEEILAGIWSEVLGKERIGIDDNFFELGGHSLKAMIMISRIHRALSVQLPLIELFAAPTISGISEYVSKAVKNEYTAIEPVMEKEYYKTSSSQKRMWLLQQFDHESTGYNMPVVLIIDGSLDKERLEEAFRELIKRHESLRTSFDMIDDVIIQRVARSVEFKLEAIESIEEAIEEAIEGFIRPFDLRQAPLLRVGLIRIGAERHYLMFDMHHIISDGVSGAILTREFMKLYDGKVLKEQRIGYKDFSEWQNEYLTSTKMREQEQYWLEQFAHEPPILDLPLDYIRPVIQSFEGDDIEFSINRELSEKLNNLAKATGTTLYMVLLSAIKILLSKYSGQVDIIVGSPIAGRSHADLEAIIGMFINTLVMRSYPEAGKTYAEFLQEIKEVALSAYENQDYQFEDLVDKLELKQDPSRNPLFDVMFMLQNMETNELEVDGLRVTEYKIAAVKAKFDLTFTAMEWEDEIHFNIEYGVGLFKKETIERMAGHLKNLLEAITTNKEMLLSDIDILSKGERNQLLYEFNDTYTDYPRDKTIQQLFEEQVAKTPEEIALVLSEDSMTYSELNAKSNQLARTLRASGVKPDDRVGIMVERSFAMIIGILGIIKAGAAYMPIDPDYPKERIKYMLEDSQVEILLTQAWLSARAPFEKQRINLDDASIYENDKTNLELVNSPSDLLYVLYTSGSTGMPKGVMMEHQAIVNLLFAMEKECPLGREDAFLLRTTYTFDLSVQEIFSWFVGCGKLVILPPEAEKSLEETCESITNHNVTHINFVPSVLAAFLDEIENNQAITEAFKIPKYFLVCGEVLRKETADAFYKLFQDAKLENLYGPTETHFATLYSTSQDQSYDTIPIGKPLANYQIYILNASNQLTPIGVTGELCIGGESLARGYLNRPELTSEKFIKNPFISGESLYRTGDLARWLPDGNIEFLGRIDHQIKIRGFRIEVAEIESCLMALAEVRAAVVLARVDATGDNYLCAYVVADKKFSTAEMRRRLGESLPDYMIPSYFLQLERLPLTANGKLDRKSLPEPDGQAEAEYVAPRNETEAILARIWSEILIRDRVGIDDNFFELGGHSLNATVMVSRIHKELDVVLPLGELFGAPSISGISEYVSKAVKSKYERIQPAMEKAYYEASSAGKRMWLLQQFDHKSTGYNMPGVLIIDGSLDKNRLENAFLELIKRHESLRTSFAMIDDVIVQIVNQSVEFKVEYAESAEENIDNIIEGFIRPFDLRQAPLLRVGLIRTCENRHYLVFDMHHIIADGVSMTILTKEFMATYAGEELREQRIGYKDFSQWQNEYLKSKQMQSQEQYWLEQFSGELPVLDLPLDYVRPAVQSFKGDSLEFTVNRELTEKLNSLASVTGTTLYMVLLSAVKILLAKYTGQGDIIVGTDIAGRSHADLENIIGMFVNTLAIRSYPERGKTYEEFLKEIKEITLAAYANQDYQFEELVDKLNIRKDASRNPLFDVMFSLANIEESKLEIEGLRFTEYKREQKSSKFDLAFTAIEVGDEIVFIVEYGVSLFKRETIERMIKHLLHLLEMIATNRTVQI